MRKALLRFLRATHLIGLADRAAAWRAANGARRDNDAYRRAHPDRVLPDPRLVFQAAGHARLEKFDRTGAEHAQMIVALLRETGLPSAPRVLEWGCGPARILAHLPRALDDEGAQVFGCDPDARAIAFARRALPRIGFERIRMAPPAPFCDSSFDAIYGVSVFTHLPETLAHAWTAELARLTKDAGLVVVTTHGARAARRLTAEGRARFDAGAYVTLAGSRAGSRTFVSYFSEAAGRRLFAAAFAEIGFRPATESFEQDIWVLRAPRRSPGA
jgi:SAM-dependent methyltransferase